MSFTPSGAVSGGAQTGFTSPTYTFTADTAPEFAKQWTISAVGGTQSGVLVHSVGNPFTVSVFRPRALKALGGANPVTGIVASVPRNTYKIIVRKGVLPYTDGPYLPAVARLELDIPAGADFSDPENVRAMMSCLIGVLSNQSAGLGDTMINGTI